MMRSMKWLSATLAIALLATAGLIAGGRSTPVAAVAEAPIVTPDTPALPPVVVQNQPTAPVVAPDSPIVYCCGGGPVDALIGATDAPPETPVGAGVKPPAGPTERVPCPHGVHFTISASTPSAATPFTADFPTIANAMYELKFGGTATNKIFRHTFNFADKFPKEKDACCQCTSAKLILKVKANQAGTKGAPDGGNDKWGIYCNGKGQQGDPIYANPVFPKGHLETVTIQLNAAALCCICQNHRLSFLVQDDTSILSATLEITACCVTKCK